jgi:hypothetical protein
MATRLAPLMTACLQYQSAFIKKRSIHDSFFYVRNLAWKLHKSNNPTLMFKPDIKKAFDSVSWDYLVDLLQHMGFPSKFREWICALLSTSSSRGASQWHRG